MSTKKPRKESDAPEIQELGDEWLDGTPAEPLAEADEGGLELETGTLFDHMQEQQQRFRKEEKAAAPPTGEAQEEIAKLKRELLYEKAELENFKRRTAQRQLNELKFAAEPLVRDLLPVLDNLERALEHAGEEEADNAAIVTGVGHVLSQLRESLGRHGVEEVATEGCKFDPNVHEAMAQVPGEADNQVADRLEKGYTLHGKLLRPAKVLVTRLASTKGDG